MARNSYISLLLFFVVNLSPVTAQQAGNNMPAVSKNSILQENFDNNSNSWIADNQWISSKISDGRYSIKCKNLGGQAGLSYIPSGIDQTKDFEVETSFEITKGSGGLIFGMTDKYDHYRIEIVDNSIVVAKNTISKNKIEKLYSVSGNQYSGSGNIWKIGVRKINSNYSILVNGSVVKEFSNIKTEGDKIGFVVGVNSEISVDYINVSYLSIPATPLISQNSVTTKDNIAVKEQDSREILAAAAILNTANSSDDPIITWISPSTDEITSLDRYQATVKAKIESPLGLSKVSFYVNDVSQGEAEINPIQGQAGYFEVVKSLNFAPGKNSVYILATNEKTTKKSKEHFFSNPNATTPIISWTTTSNKITNTDRITIEACIKSETGLRSVNLFVNGISLGEDYVFTNSNAPDCNFKWSKSVGLKNGPNNIYIIAQNNAGNTPSENLIIDYQPGIAEKRVALVMGNSEYKDKTPLKNPVNDANLMAGNLESLGFKVIKCLNAGKVEMEKALAEFSQILPDYNVALFYYAGHGIQVDGKNYLIPTDAKLATKAMCKWEAISLSDVVSDFEKYPDNINIVILDACRNDPFTDWVRGSDAGLRFITNVSGTIIGYATVEGATAADGNGANGLYTEELIRQMNIPQSIESVFKKTRVQVELRSNGTQSPRESSGLRGEFYFKKQ